MITGRKLLFIGTGLGILLIVAGMLVRGWAGGWACWNVPAMPISFGDLRTIAGAHDSLLQGCDPLAQNPGDPWGRSMNYPRVWLLAAWAGFSQAHVPATGLALVVFYLCGLWLAAPRKLGRRAALYALACLFSPAALLGVERGNTDLLIFFLMSAALACLSRSRLAAAALIFLGFILKLFPLFGFACWLRECRSVWLKVALAGAALATAYLVLTWNDLTLIRQMTPPCYWRGYGAKTWCVLASRFAPNCAGLFPVIAYGAALSLGLAAIATGVRNALRTPLREVEGAPLDAFCLGAGIYVGTFLLGHNYDYRLIFLLFTLSQLATWARGALLPARWAARLALAAFPVALWYTVIPSLWPSSRPTLALAFGCGLVATWSLYGALVYLLTSRFVSRAKTA